MDLNSAIYEKARKIDNGVVSFCARYSSNAKKDPILNPNLWGHYADNHKGICIGFSPDKNYETFDFSKALNPTPGIKNHISFEFSGQPGGTNLLSHLITPTHKWKNLLSQQDNTLLKVKYAREFRIPTPNWRKVEKNYASDKEIINSRNLDEFLSKLLKNALDRKHVVSYKHDNWKQENEYRLFGGRNKSQSIGAAINSLTFGLNTPEEAVKYITSIVARFYGPYKVELYKMVIEERVLTRKPLEMNNASMSSSQSSINEW